jgi:serine protease
MSTITGRGDYSSDGRTDVLSVDGNGALWLYRGNGLGGFSGRTASGNGWD